MAPVEQHRWALLWLALACGLVLFFSPMIPALQRMPVNQDLITFPLAMVAIAGQTLGTMGVRLHLRRRGASAPIMVTASFISALAWGVAVLAAIWGVASGPGGLAIGLLLMLPAAVLAMALQILALIVFHRAERKAPA